MTIGIYKITNTVNGKCYVGQSWNIEKRWRDYHSSWVNPQQPKLYNAFQKYGKDKFAFDVLVQLPDGLNQDHLDGLEIQWMDRLDSIHSGYNIRGGGSRGRHSPETIAKMRSAHTGKTHTDETKDKIRQLRTGHGLTSETCAKMSAANQFKPMSDETKARRLDPTYRADAKVARRLEYHRNKVKSIRSTGKPKDPISQDILDQMVSMFKAGASIGSISRQIGYSHPTVRKYLKQALSNADRASSKTKYGVV